MVRESVSQEKLDKIKRFIEQGHTYEEAREKFKCSKMTVLRAKKPEAYAKWRGQQTLMSRFVSVMNALRRIMSYGFVISGKGKKIRVFDPQTRLALEVECEMEKGMFKELRLIAKRRTSPFK